MLSLAPALTVRQPFALALVRGVKGWENRSWERDLSASGGWIWIHAGAAIHAQHQKARGLWSDMPALATLTRSAIIGAVRIGRVLPYEAVAGLPWTAPPPPGKRGLCWEVVEVMALDPIPCSGGLGLWTPDGGIRAQLATSLRMAA